MMALPDLFSNIGPGYASYNTGYNMQQQQDGTMLENMLKATQVNRGVLDNQFDQANAGNRLQQSDANLASTIGLNAQRQQGIDFTNATQPGAIAATNSTNDLIPTTNMVKKQEEMQQLYGGLAAHMASQTPTQRAATAAGFEQKYPALANDPQWQQIQDDPQQYLAGQTTAMRNNPKYLQAMDVASARTASAERIAGMNNASRENIAAGKEAAAARIADLKRGGITDLASAAMKGPKVAAAWATAKAVSTDDPDEQKYWSDTASAYQQQVLDAVAAGKPDTPQVGGIPYVNAPARQTPMQLPTRPQPVQPPVQPPRAPADQAAMDQINLESYQAMRKATTDPDQQKVLDNIIAKMSATKQDTGAAAGTGVTSTGKKFTVIKD